MAYAGVNIPFAMMQVPAFIILPSLYVQYGGLDMVTVGFILTLLRVADAVMDPTIGYLSDRTRGKFGRRKPWIAAGGLVAAPAIVWAFHPGSGGGYLGFTLSYIFLTLGWTFAEIPIPPGSAKSPATMPSATGWPPIAMWPGWWARHCSR
jgi:Na+/melibiose symporter-like transporter